MAKLPNKTKGSYFSIYFSEDESPLLDKWAEYCKNNYTSKSGWVKRQIHECVKSPKELVGV